MNERSTPFYDTDDDLDDEAEARERYGDLIIDTENGKMPEPEPHSPEPVGPAPHSQINFTLNNGRKVTFNPTKPTSRGEFLKRFGLG